MAKETPLMKQYNQIKSKYPDALLLFRVGDFYETFGEDAVKAAAVLDIVLTNRNNGALGVGRLSVSLYQYVFATPCKSGV